MEHRTIFRHCTIFAVEIGGWERQTEQVMEDLRLSCEQAFVYAEADALSYDCDISVIVPVLFIAREVRRRSDHRIIIV